MAKKRAKRIPIDKYREYADDVVTGRIVSCHYIFKACQRYLSWFERDDMYFDHESVDRVIAFIGKLKHFKGSVAGKPFTLEKWQVWILSWAFGFRWKHNKLRVVRNVQLQIPRKNGKSALCAALACYGLVADGEQGASVILAANSANQAHMIFEFCQKFLDPYGKIFQRYRDSIKFPATNSTLQIVSTNTKAIEGENASMYIIDEIELAENSKMYDTLSTSTVARTQPMGWIIGTAGFDTDSFCYSMIQVQKDILDGNTEDDSSIGIFYEVDEGDDPFNDDEQRTILRKTNPNLGVTCQIDAIEGEKRKAGNNPRLKASVLMRHFDLWTNSLEEWIPEPIIVKNLYNINLDDYADRTMYLGIDLSAAKDLTCISVCVHDEDRDEYIWKNWYWVSQEQATKSKKRQEYQMWIKQGYVTVCPGHTIDYEMMYDKVNELCSKYYVAYIGYDPYNATLLSRKLENEGRPMIPYGMSLPNMNRPMKEFEIAILNDRVRIDNNPLNKWCLGNTSPKVDIHENIYPVKTNAENKIDGTVAMLISYGVCLQNEYPIAMGAVLS